MPNKDYISVSLKYDNFDVIVSVTSNAIDLDKIFNINLTDSSDDLYRFANEIGGHIDTNLMFAGRSNFYGERISKHLYRRFVSIYAYACENRKGSDPVIKLPT